MENDIVALLDRLQSGRGSNVEVSPDAVKLQEEIKVEEKVEEKEE